MTRAEINRIKARMLDEVLASYNGFKAPSEVFQLLDTQKYTVEILEKTMETQNEELKENGYQ